MVPRVRKNPFQRAACSPHRKRIKVLACTISVAHSEIKCMDLHRLVNLNGAHCKLVFSVVKLLQVKCIIVTVEFQWPVEWSITGLDGDGSGGALQ